MKIHRLLRSPAAKVVGRLCASRNLVLTAITVACWLVLSLSPKAHAQNSSGLVAAYSFREGTGNVLTDSSGYGNNGTISNATWSSAGRYGGALSFNGTNSRVDVPDAASLDLTSAMTLEAWVRPSTVTGWRTVLLKEQSGGLVYCIYANSNNNRPSTHIYVTSEVDTRSSAKLSANTWTHLAATYDGTVLRLYVNGNQASSRSVGGNILTSNGVLRIGGNSVWGEYFSGLIDEVRIYNRVLTATEIQTDMNTAVGGTPPPPPPPDTTPPTVSITSPLNGATVSGTVALSANASDNVGVAGVQFFVNGAAVGAEDTTSPQSVNWDTTTVVNGGLYSITARARDAAGNQTTSSVISVSVNNSTPPPPPPSFGLVAAYGFDEGTGNSANDVSGNGNNGVINGATWSSAGRYGTALSFNGSSSKVDIPDSATLNLTNGMTLEAWVRPASLSSWQSVVLKEQSGGLVYGLYANTDTNTPSVHISINQETDTRGIMKVPLSTWTHLAGTYDGNVLHMYVNGTLVSAKNIGGTIRNSNGALRIGGNTVWGEYFSGLIDEVRIYSRALTSSEIQTDMNTALGAAPPQDNAPPSVTVTGPAAGATVTGRTTLYADATDDIGVAGVQFYIDGSAFGPEIPGPVFTTTWDTTAGTNGSHTITAVARDSSGNITTSAPFTVTVANTNDPALVGAWGPLFNWPIVAINMVVTRTGEVMSWDGPPSNGGSSAQLWNPATGAFSSIANNLTNMFCNAALALADGRVLAIGGHADFGVGVRNADIFDPVTKLWSRVAPMNYARWYPTATVLPDGRVLSISGSDTCETCIVAIPEIYDPVINSWTAMPNAAYNVNLYPFMFVLSDGRVLEAGCTRQVTETRVLDVNTQTWRTVDPTPRDGHSAVMYEINKIMKSGSAADVGVSTAPSASTTFVLDMNDASPKWQQTPNMAYPRSFHNLTLLPDGSVLATGGGATRDGIDYANSVLAAELWSPQTKTWTTLSAMQVGRLYHGTAVLLLDGRVLVAGSGRAGPDPQFSAQIFSPPYLFKGPRPSISSAPAGASYGSTFFVGTPNAADITSVTLRRIAAATHAFDMEQRLLRLNFSQAAGGLNVVAPANANLAPPGYYTVYLLNSLGAPSPGAVIQIH